MKKSSWIAKCFAFEQSKKIILILISVLYSLIVTNALGPSSYGLAVYFISFTSVVMIFGIAFLQTMVSVFLPKWRNVKLIKIIAKTEMLIAIPVLLTLAILSPQINTMLNKQSPLILSFASFHMLLMIIFTTTTAILRSLKLFGKNLKLETTMQLLNLAATTILIFVFGLKSLAVVFGQMIAVAIAITLFFKWWKDIKDRLKLKDANIEKTQSQELKKFAIEGLPCSVVNRIYKFLYTLLFGLFVPTIMLGYYYLAEKIFSVVIWKTTSSLGDVIMPFTMEEKNKENLAKLLSLSVKMNFLIAVAGSIIISIAMPLILFIFFPAYYNAINIVPFLALIAITRSLTIVNQGFSSLNRMKEQLKINLTSYTAAVLFGLIFAPAYGIYALLIMPVIANIINAAMSKYLLLKLGVEVSYMPNKGDFIFFWNKSSKLLRSSVRKIKMLLKG